MRRLSDLWKSHTLEAEAGPFERGAVAIIVALCLIVLFGFAAWVIDGSALFQERRELQRGADFAALTIAADCARGDCGGATGVPRLTAEAVVDANSTDGQSTVPSDGVTFPAANQVKVRAVTFDARANTDGDTSTVDYRFAQVFGKSGLQVSAEATATWDVVGSGSTLPLTVSMCEWQEAIALGYGPGNESTILFHDGGNASYDEDSACPVGPTGQDANGDGFLPAGFGWLNQDDCVANINVTGGALWAARKGGNAPPNDCDPPVIDQVLFLPIFDDFIFKNDPAWAGQCNPPSGSDVGCYRIAGFAAFHLTGFRFPGNGWSEPAPPPCSGQTSCIRGWFTQDLCQPGECSGGGGINFGATTVWLLE